MAIQEKRVVIKERGSYQDVAGIEHSLRKAEIIFLVQCVWHAPACWQANEKMIIAGDRDETMPIAQFFLQRVTGNRVCCRWMMPPAPAFRHAERTIRLRDYALSAL